jgi:hypothetical protein
MERGKGNEVGLVVRIEVKNGMSDLLICGQSSPT